MIHAGKLMENQIKVFQVYFKNYQYANLDKNFTPYLNPSNGNFENSYFETSVFLKEFYRVKEYKYTGFFSWKFYFKTQLNGNEIFKFIDNNLNYDVYIFNPYFEFEKLYSNVWVQGELHHPGIIELAEKIYSLMGLNLNLRQQVHTSRELLYCNYWIGSVEFWEAYMPYLRSFISAMEKLGADDKEKLLSNSGYYKVTNYIPFVLERVFSTYLYLNPKIKVCPYQYSDDERAKIISSLRSAAEREFEVIHKPLATYRKLLKKVGLS